MKILNMPCGDGIDDYMSTAFVLDPSDGAFSTVAWIKGISKPELSFPV